MSRQSMKEYLKRRRRFVLRQPTWDASQEKRWRKRRENLAYVRPSDPMPQTVGPASEVRTLTGEELERRKRELMGVPKD